MHFTHDFGILGGDLRQVYMANLLIEDGFSVIAYGVQPELLHKACEGADSLEHLVKSAKVIAAPIPFTKNKTHIFSNVLKDDLTVEKLCRKMKKEHCFFAGNIPAELTAECKEKGNFYYDFMKNEELAMYNAIATAEGTILEAIRHHPVNLHKSQGLILGYGTCAKVLAEKLKGLSVDVIICARSATARMEAKAFGYKTTDFTELPDVLSGVEFIFNTVPAMVMPREVLRYVKQSSIIIDIASMPGGVDKEAVKEFGLHEEHCLALPGIYAPKSSAEYLKEVMLSVCSSYIKK